MEYDNNNRERPLLGSTNYSDNYSNSNNSSSSSNSNNYRSSSSSINRIDNKNNDNTISVSSLIGITSVYSKASATIPKGVVDLSKNFYYFSLVCSMNHGNDYD